MLELAEAGQTPVDLTNVSVSAVVATILDEKKQTIEAGGIKVDVNGDLGVVHANEAHIYQLFANLLDNAVKYCRVDSPVIAVNYAGDDPDGAHRYVVRDNGPGIAPSSLAHLFEPFFKGESGGTGIGLATVEKIVKVYRGEITARNDKGAVFEFTIRDSASRRTQPD
jgi:signal transduction histidine kinase